MTRIIFSLIFTTIIPLSIAHSQESLGQGLVSELFIEANYSVTEGQKVNASISDSEVSFKWLYDNHLSTKISLGSNSILGRPVFFKNHTSTEQFGVTAAYAHYDGVIFDIKAGLIPTQFGLYGAKEKFELRGQRSLLFKNKVIGLRDIGISAATNHNGYSTSLTIHNGEGFENDDSRMFFTGRWTWTDQKYFIAGLSAQTGTTKPESTSGESTTITNFDGSLISKWKIASLFIDWAPNKWIFLSENYYGSMVQEKSESSLTGGSVEVGYLLSPKATLLLKQDFFDPNIHTSDDRVSETSFIVDIHGTYKNSSLLFVFTKKTEEGQSINDDYFSVTWKVTPQIALKSN